MIEQLKLLFKLWWQPSAAMGEILDRGSLLFASIAVIAATFALRTGPLQFNFYMPLLALAGAFVPGILLLAALIGRLGGLGMVFQRDYSPLLTCAGMAWTAAQIPVIVAGGTAPPEVFPIIAGLAYLYFAVLMFFAVRTVFGMGNGESAGVIALSWIPVAAGVVLMGPLGFIFHMLASPFFLFFLFYYLRPDFSSLGAGLRRGQNYRRMLEAAAVNPHDGSAQYELGLIHQQRHQYSEAIRRFQAAVAIDPTETDAHFQLGRIAHQQGRDAEALAHLEKALRLDEKHSMNEVHREIGAVYLALGRLDDARRELTLYTVRREYDPEGLYYYGQMLDRTGDAAGARDAYARAVESARTAPHYRRRYTAPWSRLAQKQLGKLK